MTITVGLAAELDLLTQALDLPDTDMAQTLTRLADDAQTAVKSYLGLSVLITANESKFDLTFLNAGRQPEHIRTSLLVPLSPGPVGGRPPAASVALILYAATPGAFIDLAADLSWITSRPLADFHLDEHLIPPPNFAESTALADMSKVNQAIGVLIRRGSTPEQAECDLCARATTAGIDLVAAATLILASLTPLIPDPDDV